MMIFDKKEEKILRAGIKIPATSKEKTYRLFIEEIPGPRKKTEGTSVAIAIKFGVPIFVKPLKEETKGEIGKIGMAKGLLEVPVRNSGNVHFIIDSIAVRGRNTKGEEVFTRDLAGWYLLSGAARVYTATIPPDVCQNLAKITLEVKTDKFTLSGNLDADKTMCLP
jgi:fimbrial chaperone protein